MLTTGLIDLTTEVMRRLAPLCIYNTGRLLRGDRFLVVLDDSTGVKELRVPSRAVASACLVSMRTMQRAEGGSPR